ncbi:MAG: hypothetical protein HY548_03865, partial [Elusimicrobia bacterium]|nr:hypothetical protein [Elusimicrobiota bacterium]
MTNKQQEKSNPSSNQNLSGWPARALAFLAIIFFSGLLHAGAPAVINYQGKLTDENGNPLTGSHSFAFSIHDDDSAGSLLWTETKDLYVENGVFNVQLGTTTVFPDDLFNGSVRYLRVNVDGQDLSPRERLVSAPFAIRVADNSVGTNEISDNSVAEGDLNTASVDGRYVTRGTAQTITSTKTFSGGATVTGLPDPSADSDAATRGWVNGLLGTSAGGWTDDGPVVRLTDASDAVKVSTFTSTYGVYLATVSGGVGIGTTAPSSVLSIKSVTPIVTLEDSNFGGRVYAIRNGASGTGRLDIYDATAGKSRFLITSDGEVYIGTTTNYEGNTSKVFVYGGANGANIDVMGEGIAGRDQAVIELQGSDYETAGNSARLQFYGPYGLSTVDTMGFPNQNLGVLAFKGANTALIGTEDDVPLIFATDNSERMRIHAAGGLLVGSSITANGGFYGDGSNLSGIPTVANTVTIPDNQTITGAKTFASSVTITSVIFTGGTAADGTIDFGGGDYDRLNASIVTDLTDGNSTVLHTHASGDASTLDGIDSTQFLRSDVSDSVTTGATLSINSGAAFNALA